MIFNIRYLIKDQYLQANLSHLNLLQESKAAAELTCFVPAKPHFLALIPTASIKIRIKNKSTKEYLLIEHSSHYYFLIPPPPNSPVKLRHPNSFNLLSMKPFSRLYPRKKHDKRRTVTVLVQEYHRGKKKEEKYMYNSAVSDLRPAPLPSAFTGVTAA